jgi:DNA-binding GntR family transcriptional regulator
MHDIWNVRTHAARLREGEQMETTQSDLLNRRTASHAVAAQLRSEIQRGELRAGSRLRQGEIAQRFGVSTTPVREAFALLQAQGLVRVDPHRGAIVFHPTGEDLLHLYEIREALEVLAVEKALKNFTPENLNELQAIIDKMKKTSDEQEWLDLNSRFHIGVYEPTNRPRLIGLIADLRDSSTSYIHMLLASHPTHSRPDHEHQDILDACRDGDLKRAKRAVRAHMRNTVDHVMRLIEEQEKGAAP